jgi:hypothetical protein
MSKRGAKRRTKAKRVITGRDPTSQLYRAVQRYVEANNGSIVVIGGGPAAGRWASDLLRCGQVHGPRTGIRGEEMKRGEKLQ